MNAVASTFVAASEGRTDDESEPTRPRRLKMDDAAFYGLTGEVVRALAPHTESGDEALILDFLTSFGNAAGSEAHAEAEGAQHPGRLWALLVADTAKGRKGSSRRQIERIFEIADPRWVADRRLMGLGSGEALIADLARDEADPRRLVVEEEFSRVLRVAERQGSTFTETLRPAWDHVGRLANRTKPEVLQVPRSHVSLIAHITLPELKRRLTDTDTANGFVNRFLIGCVGRSKLLPDGGALSTEELRLLGDTVKASLSRAGSIRRRMVRTPDAAARWRELYFEMADNDFGGLAGAATARAEAQVLRLSVVYALTDGVHEIGLPHLEAAWAVWRFCEESALRIFGEALGDSVADRLLEAIEAAGTEGLDFTQQRDVFGRHVSAERLAASRGELERVGRIETRTEETAGRPRRVSVAVARKAQKARKGGALVAYGANRAGETDQTTAPEPELTEEQALENLRTILGATPIEARRMEAS